MYLGNSSDGDEKSFFIPLLPVWKKKAQSGDDTLSSRVEALERLKQIQILTQENVFGLPDSARRLFSHGGYKSVLTTADTGELIFAFRDIEAVDDDGAGRRMPFLLVIVGTDESDKDLLEKVATYAASHLESFSDRISKFFVFESGINGISFSLAAFTEYLQQTAAVSDNVLLTLRGKRLISRKQKKTPMLVLPEGINRQLAAREQALDCRNVAFIPMVDIVPLDKRKRLAHMAQKQKKPFGGFFLPNRMNVGIIGGVILLGVVSVYLISKK